jgi:Pretoxin HINT domain
MFQLALLAVGLAGISMPGSTSTRPSPSDLKSYDAIQAKAGRDPAAQVKLALWCEAHGLSPQRVRHLARAVLLDPANVTARGLLGLISFRGEWLSPERAGAKWKADEALTAKLAAYNARRDALEASLDPTKRGGTVDRRKAARAHEQLGLWCRQQGLQAEATAHFSTAVQLNPYRDATWRHLGYVKHNGRWMSRAQITEENQEADAQRQADRRWEPLLKKWKGWLGDKSRRGEAEAALAHVTDVRAVPLIMRVFGNGSPENQAVAVSTLAHVEGPAASKELARLAVFAGSELVRYAAIGALRGRPLRDFAGPLVEMIRSPARYQIQPVQGPGTQGALSVETPRFRLLRTYDAPPVFALSPNFRGYIGYDANGMPLIAGGRDLERLGTSPFVANSPMLPVLEARTLQMLAAANLKAVATQQQIVADVKEIEASNEEAHALNGRIIPVLESLAGASGLKDDENAWQSWWYDQLGYRYEPPPQVQIVQSAEPQLPPPRIYSCFAPGTPVLTREGSRPIEAIRVGDHVLSQDVSSGRLDYQPVLVVHHSQPAKTLRITLEDGQTLLPSVYHRFWRAGRGWAMARELASGDSLRNLGGVVQVISVEDGQNEPLYNLTVAQNRSFFVGQGGVLVHDNTLPEARLKPFDAPPTLDTAPSRVK